MRIIAGTWKGRRIQPPPSDRTRPILDRAKTVLFDQLGARLAEPGRLPPVAVLDLFAGTGTLGLEALSRGARFCAFFEQHAGTARLLRTNLDTLGAINEAVVVEGDATAARFPEPPAGGCDPRYELIFVDPPYRMLEGDAPAPAVARLLNKLVTSPLIAPTALVVVRHGTKRRNHPDLSPLVEVTSREVGGMALRLMTHPAGAHADGSSAHGDNGGRV